MAERRKGGKQVCREVDRGEGTPVLCIGEGKGGGMGKGTSVDKRGEDTPFCKAEGIWVGKREEDIPFYMAEGTSVCKVRKWEGMVRNSHHYNGWNSLSTRVPRHPKKSTRLMFPVVFSLEDSLC